MRRKISISLIFICLTISVSAQPPKKISNVTGDVFRHENFPTKISLNRNVDVWLPPGYDKNTNERYAVLYMHDGQNLFNPAEAFGGADWGVDETLTKLIGEKKVRLTIVVGIWNTPYRVTEYAPQRAADLLTRKNIEPSPLVKPQEGASDKYLKFIVGELKPFIDRTYRTKTGQSDTFIMGSSMGGLISLYAISEYPDVFGGAGGVSTHFPLGGGIIIGYLEKFLPSPNNHKIYFDYGTEGLDAAYEPFQTRADELMRAKGYERDKNWVTRKFDGADHNEKSWARRIDAPLVFLLKP